MRLDWKLLPLQRKLEWDLEQARGGLAQKMRLASEVAVALREMQDGHKDQAAAALAAAQTRINLAVHGQAVTYLAGIHAQLTALRARRNTVDVQVTAARDECQRCNVRLKALTSLHDKAIAEFDYAVQREAAKQADFAWLARVAGGGDS